MNDEEYEGSIQSLRKDDTPVIGLVPRNELDEPEAEPLIPTPQVNRSLGRIQRQFHGSQGTGMRLDMPVEPGAEPRR